MNERRITDYIIGLLIYRKVDGIYILYLVTSIRYY